MSFNATAKTAQIICVDEREDENLEDELSPEELEQKEWLLEQDDEILN